MSDDLYDYQPQTNPFQMTPNEPDTQSGQPDVGTPAPQPVMSVEQALEQVPKTLTYRDLAVAHLRKMEGQADSATGEDYPRFESAKPEIPWEQAPHGSIGFDPAGTEYENRRWLPGLGETMEMRKLNPEEKRTAANVAGTVGGLVGGASALEGVITIPAAAWGFMKGFGTAYGAADRILEWTDPKISWDIKKR